MSDDEFAELLKKVETLSREEMELLLRAIDEEEATRQRRNLGQLGRKLDAMPTTPADDGLANRHHDQFLYGDRSKQD